MTFVGQEARGKLLLEDMNLWETQVSLLPQNPFTLQDQNSENPAPKLWVENVPLSVDEKVIETALNKQDCKMWSTGETKMKNLPGIQT